MSQIVSKNISVHLKSWNLVFVLWLALLWRPSCLQEEDELSRGCASPMGAAADIISCLGGEPWFGLSAAEPAVFGLLSVQQALWIFIYCYAQAPC